MALSFASMSLMAAWTFAGSLPYLPSSASAKKEKARKCRHRRAHRYPGDLLHGAPVAGSVVIPKVSSLLHEARYEKEIRR